MGSTRAFLSTCAATGLLAAGALAAPPPSGAAVPDGRDGPWADAVVSSSQSLDAHGKPVSTRRSDVAQALGPAEGTDTERTAYTLGLRGQVTLRFENAACNGPGPDLRLVETTREPYGPEEAAIYARSERGEFVRLAERLNKDGVVSLPPGIASAAEVLVVDVTDQSRADGTSADGYDVDGVRALHTAGCATPAAPGGPADSRDPDAAPGIGRDPAIAETVLPSRRFVAPSAHRRMRIVRSRLRRDGRGTVRIVVSNTNAHGVFVSATLRPRSTTRGRRARIYGRTVATIDLPPHSRRAARLRLNRSGLRSVKRGRRTRLRLVLAIRDPSGRVRRRGYNVSVAGHG